MVIHALWVLMSICVMVAVDIQTQVLVVVGTLPTVLRNMVTLAVWIRMPF